ncbi:MAG: hypothetical protein ACKO83_10995 [Roseiflexaceae bacterium]
MQWFSRTLAGHVLLVAFGILLLVHLLILLGAIPYTAFWGGRADARTIVGLTIFALGVTLFVLFITASNLQYIIPLFPGIMRILMWGICAFLLLNTLGNALSNNATEQYYLAPLTFILAICAGRVAWSR